MTKVIKTPCISCKHLIIPRGQVKEIWYNHLCKMYKSPKRIDYYSGKMVSEGLNEYLYCQEVRRDENFECPDYEQ